MIVAVQGEKNLVALMRRKNERDLLLSFVILA